MGLVDLATAKEWLPHLVDTTGPHSGNALTDDELQSYIDAASKTAERVARRKLSADDYVEVCDGPGRRELLLSQWPILSVTSVIISSDGSFSTTDPESSDTYEIDGAPGVLARRSLWPEGYRNIQVTYRAGYELPANGGDYTVPEDLERAVIEVIDWMRQRDLNQTIGIRTVIGADGLQTSYSLDVPMSARSVFESYGEVKI